MCFGTNILRMRTKLNAEHRFEIDTTYAEFDEMPLLLPDVLRCLQTRRYRSTIDFSYTIY